MEQKPEKNEIRHNAHCLIDKQTDEKFRGTTQIVLFDECSS